MNAAADVCKTVEKANAVGLHYGFEQCRLAVMASLLQSIEARTNQQDLLALFAQVKALPNPNALPG